MSLWEYLSHLKEKEKEDKEQNEESINSESTIDEMIDEKLRIFEQLIKDDKGLKLKKGSRVVFYPKKTGLYNYYNLWY